MKYKCFPALEKKNRCSKRSVSVPNQKILKYLMVPDSPHYTRYTMVYKLFQHYIFRNALNRLQRQCV